MSAAPSTDLTDDAFVERLLASLRDDRDGLAALAAADLDAPVPHCPGWTLRDLLDHMGRIHRWAYEYQLLPPDWPRPEVPPGVGDRPDAVEWVVEGLDLLIERFATTDLTAACATFAGPAVRAWWLRRQAMETAVHRWDAETTAGVGPAPVDADVAEAGVDEWCEIEAARWYSPSPDLSLTVHLHATDDAVGDGEWFLEATPDGLAWEHGHRKGDIAVRASRSDLFLLAWRRVEPATLEVFGDVARLAAFLGATEVD